MGKGENNAAEVGTEMEGLALDVNQQTASLHLHVNSSVSFPKSAGPSNHVSTLSMHATALLTLLCVLPSWTAATLSSRHIKRLLLPHHSAHVV